jgi:hypothetical protein
MEDSFNGDSEAYVKEGSRNGCFFPRGAPLGTMEGTILYRDFEKK